MSALYPPAFGTQLERRTSRYDTLLNVSIVGARRTALKGRKHAFAALAWNKHSMHALRHRVSPNI